MSSHPHRQLGVRTRASASVFVIVTVTLLCASSLVSLVSGQRSESSEERATATSSSSSELDSATDPGTYTLAPAVSVSKTVHEHVSTSSSFSTSSVGYSPSGGSSQNHDQRVNTNIPVPLPQSQSVPATATHQVRPDTPYSNITTSTRTTVELISPLPVIPITIDIAPLDPRDIEIFSTIPPKHPSESERPIAEIYLAGLNDELTLLTNVSHSEVLIDRKYVFDPSRSEFVNVVLVCTANYPVRWTYAGDGAPTRMYSSELRTFDDFHNASSYEYFTTLVLMQERNNEHLTGTYTCEGTEEANQEARVFYHLYFPGGYGFPTIRNRVLRSDQDSRVTLPCESTNPKLPMTLYKIYPKEEAANLTSSDGVTFDHKSGFKMDLRRFTGRSRNPYGTYYCSLNDGDSFWKMDLVPRKEDEVHVEPVTSLVPQTNFAPNQTFSCAAKEPVTLSFPQNLEYGITKYSQHPSEHFPFVAMYKIDSNLPLSALSPYFKIECVSTRTRRVLHSWEYSRIGSEELAIKFDVDQRRILCCSTSGLATVQEIVKCETKTDCEIKKKCFENGRCEYPFPPKFVSAPAGCTAMEFLERVPTHVIKCSVGEVAKTVTVVETIDRNDVHMIEENGSGSQANVPTDLVLKIGLLSQSAATNEVKVKCSASLYFFSTSLVFAQENADGSFEYISRDLVDISDPYEPILVTRIGRNTRRVHCFAPLAGSSEWRNVSVAVVAAEPTTTTTSTPRSLSRGLPRGRTRLLGG